MMMDMMEMTISWRSTLVSHNLASPTQLLMVRKFKSLLPTRIVNQHDDDNVTTHRNWTMMNMFGHMKCHAYNLVNKFAFRTTTPTAGS